MPEFGQVYAGGGVVRTYGHDSAGSSGTTLTANGSSGVKGTTVELTSATEFDANWVIVHANQFDSLKNFEFDILIGAATEQVLIPDLFVISRKVNQGGYHMKFPMFVPQGSRLSARCASAGGGGVMDLSVTLLAGTAIAGGSGPPAVEVYGASGTVGGTTVDSGGAAHTKGSWTEVTSATTRDHHWLGVAVQAGDNFALENTFLFDIGIGAASEQVLIPDVALGIEDSGDITMPAWFEFPVYIPAGSRLSMRSQSTSTDAGDRILTARLYGAG